EDWITAVLKPPTEAVRKRLAALEIWRASRPAAGTLAETYLRARGLALPAGCRWLRFHPRLPHRPSGETWPAMVAAVRDGADARFLGVHRTYLRADGSGKAAVDPVKMSLGPIAGGAVRLAPAGARLICGEGIESTLGAMAASALPGWAALSTSGLKAIKLPAEVREIIIAADGDRPGEEAALVAARRWAAEGRAVRIARAPGAKDFGDAIA
ncbi:MAG: toprim domain-containing protein, partial [Defluviicoccus sp.]